MSDCRSSQIPLAVWFFSSAVDVSRLGMAWMDGHVRQRLGEEERGRLGVWRSCRREGNTVGNTVGNIVSSLLGYEENTLRRCSFSTKKKEGR